MNATKVLRNNLNFTATLGNSRSVLKLACGGAWRTRKQHGEISVFLETIRELQGRFDQGINVFWFAGGLGIINRQLTNAFDAAALIQDD